MSMTGKTTNEHFNIGLGNDVFSLYDFNVNFEKADNLIKALQDADNSHDGLIAELNATLETLQQNVTTLTQSNSINITNIANNTNLFNELRNTVATKGTKHILFHYKTTNENNMLSNNGSFNITDEMVAILDSGKYLLEVVVNYSNVYSSGNTTAYTGSLGIHYSVPVNRHNPTPHLVRVNKSGNTLTYQCFGNNSADCYLACVYLYAL